MTLHFNKNGRLGQKNTKNLQKNQIFVENLWKNREVLCML